MTSHGGEIHPIDEILAAARARLDRVEPYALETERLAGALIVDTRPVQQRQRDGELPGAVVQPGPANTAPRGLAASAALSALGVFLAIWLVFSAARKVAGTG